VSWDWQPIYDVRTRTAVSVPPRPTEANGATATGSTTTSPSTTASTAAVASSTSTSNGHRQGFPAIYGEPLLDSLLETYAHTPSFADTGASILVSLRTAVHKHVRKGKCVFVMSLQVPVGACAAIRSLLAISKGKLVVLVGDKVTCANFFPVQKH
jgi:hypothetical protein